MFSGFSQVVFNLYQGCREQPVQDFQDWAFEQIRNVLPFDAGIWLTGSVGNGKHDIHSSHFFKVSPQVLVDWAKCKNRMVFSERVFRSPGTSFTCVAADEFDEELLAHSRRYQIEHLLATTTIDPVSSLSELISLYRADPAQPFEEQERVFQQNLVPHLAETWRINRALHLSGLSQPACVPLSRSAAAAPTGTLHLIEPGFARLVRDEWPDWHGPRLPDEIVEAIAANSSRFVGKSMVVAFFRLGELVFMRGRKRNAVDSLSQRELEVARHFSEGLTYKEIAAILKLSPATIRNYLNSAYLKLEINNKTKLVNALKDYS